MATFQNTVTIARPADEVFAFLADLGNIPAWNYAISVAPRPLFATDYVVRYTQLSDRIVPGQGH